MNWRTSGLEWTRDGASYLHFSVLGPAPLRPSVRWRCTMSTGSSVDWRSMRKHFLISFFGALLFAVVIYFGGDFVAESRQVILLIIAAGLLWCVCAWSSSRLSHILYVVAVAAGLTWGFLFSMSAAISIQNGRVSVWWPAMIPGLLLIPVAATVTVLPFWYFGKRAK